MLKKTKGSQRKDLRKVLDRVHSRLIRHMYGNVCVVCGSTENIECGHIFKREGDATRWDIAEDGDCHPQCHNCNAKHERDRAPYDTWYIEKFGQMRFDNLRRRHGSIMKLADSDLKAMITSFESQMST